MKYPVVVMDCGTGYTKMGYAGNHEPAFVIPTVVGELASSSTTQRSYLEDLNFVIGQEALEKSQNAMKYYPIKNGVIESWDHMERFWQQCFYKYLRCDPENQSVILTESPMNTPENREYTAEVMFETFGVQGLYVGESSLLSLTASWDSERAIKRGLAGMRTGLVVDAGDGGTSIIPVVEEYLVNSCVRNLPITGKNVTSFIASMLKDREEALPTEEVVPTAQLIKEQQCYVCKDIAEEFQAYDASLTSNVSKLTGLHQKTNKEWSIDVAYEKFMAPEVYFYPGS